MVMMRDKIRAPKLLVSDSGRVREASAVFVQGTARLDSKHQANSPRPRYHTLAFEAKYFLEEEASLFLGVLMAYHNRVSVELPRETDGKAVFWLSYPIKNRVSNISKSTMPIRHGIIS